MRPATILRGLTLAAAITATAMQAAAQDAGPSPQAADPMRSARTEVQPVPGAMPGSDTVPSTLSEKNAADDCPITLDFTFRNLSDEQRRAIYQALKDKPPAQLARGAEQVGVELPAAVPAQPMPGDAAAQVPQTKGYQYVVAGGKVLLISPANRIVVGVFH